MDSKLEKKIKADMTAGAKTLKGIPIVNSYTYLGFEFDKKGSLDKFIKRIRKKTFAIAAKIKQVTDKMPLYKRAILVKVLKVSNFDYIGPIILLANKGEILRIRRTIRRLTRMILGLGFNTKNGIVERIVSPYRETLWLRRLKKICKNWDDKGININAIKSKIPEIEKDLESLLQDEIIPNEEINLRDIDKKIIDICNIFNRSECSTHKGKYLNTKHLEEEHGVKFSYEDIYDMLSKKDNKRITEAYNLFTGLFNGN